MIVKLFVDFNDLGLNFDGKLLKMPQIINNLKNYIFLLLTVISLVSFETFLSIVGVPLFLESPQFGLETFDFIGFLLNFFLLFSFLVNQLGLLLQIYLATTFTYLSLIQFFVERFDLIFPFLFCFIILLDLLVQTFPQLVDLAVFII